MQTKIEKGLKKRLALRPGSGWAQLSIEVYEYKNGTRIHVSGLCRMPDGKFIAPLKDLKSVNKFIRANGNNRKRGLMAWAKSLND